MPKINKKIFLVGGDVSRSKSYLIHNALYNFLGLDFCYELVSVDSNKEFLNFLNDHLNSDFFASNVTFPYKTFAKNYVLENGSYVSDTCHWADGCNLLISPNLSAFNYDGYGCCMFLELQGILLKNKTITICGTGATAKSIACAMLQNGAKKINLLSRTKKRILELKKTWKYFNNKKIFFCIYDDCSSLLQNTDILIDACPKAKYIDIWEAGLINLRNLESNACVMDVLYKDKDMALECLAKDNNLLFYNGKGMLISQAVLCVQEICRHLNINNKNTKDFKKMYNVALDAINQ